MSILPNSASCGSYPRTFPEGRCVLSHRGFLPRLAASWSDTPSVPGESRRTTAGSRRPSPGRRCTRGRRPGGTGGQHRSSAPGVPRDPGGAGVGSPGGTQLGGRNQDVASQACLKKNTRNGEEQLRSPLPSSKKSVMVAEVQRLQGLEASMEVRMEDMRRLSLFTPKRSSQNFESSCDKPKR